MISIKWTLVAALVSAPMFGAGPFGLRRGMSVQEIITLVGQKNVERVSRYPDMAILKTVPKPHSAFAEYSLIISPKGGLLKIVATSKPIQTSAYGSELQAEYDELQEALIKVYGIGKSFNHLKAGSIWDEPRDWMTSLLKQERRLSTYWQLSDHPENITTVSLETEAISSDSGQIILAYEFAGFSEYMREQRDKEAQVF